MPRSEECQPLGEGSHTQKRCYQSNPDKAGAAEGRYGWVCPDFLAGLGVMSGLAGSPRFDPGFLNAAGLAWHIGTRIIPGIPWARLSMNGEHVGRYTSLMFVYSSSGATRPKCYQAGPSIFAGQRGSSKIVGVSCVTVRRLWSRSRGSLLMKGKNNEGT